MEEFKYLAIGLTLIFIFSMIFWIGGSAFEAMAYENVTGKEVSLFDAMFLELRVMSE